MDPHFDGVIFQTHPEEMRRRLRFEHPPFALLDVRSDRSGGSIEGARALAVADLDAGLPGGTTPATEFFVAGEDLHDATTREVSRKLRELGAIRVTELAGGHKLWSDSGFPLS